jgi:hypothetical protein
MAESGRGEGGEEGVVEERRGGEWTKLVSREKSEVRV